MKRAIVVARLRRALPERVASWGRRHHLGAWPPVGSVRFGSLRRVDPVSEVFGFDRGTPVDRFYIDRFIAEHASDLDGRVLEFGEALYIARHAERVTHGDVFEVAPGPGVSVVGDLTVTEGLPERAFDCIVCTQVLPFTYDFRLAVENLHRMLAPGGVLLLTAPVINRICRDDLGATDYWRLTSAAARRLFGEVFGAERVEVAAHGNVLSAIALLEGLALEELTTEELGHDDPAFEVVVQVRATRV